MPRDSNVTILHVDDYDSTRYIVNHILHQEGFEVIEATNGREAIQRATENPRLIILDVNLPDMSGWDVCRQLKTNPVTASIPVIFLSATYVSTADRVRGLRDGADSFLTEPVEPTELVATVQALLRARQMEGMLREKNQELQRLVQAMHGIHAGPRQTSRALEESSRGVRALHAELDERAEHLGRLQALQARCLIDLSHEFRTPLNSILTLSRFLLEHTDGTLTTEQERQTLFIHRAAETLLTLANNTLEMVRAETGRLPVRPETFTVDDLFGTLRGMFMPILNNTNIALVFEEPRDMPPFHTDQGKVLQILRNLICNALRFTERGEARVSAALALEGQAVEFRVADTGIGIALQDHEHIFEKFFQIRRPGQEQGKGVGLGLALVRELAQLLNGRITLQSQPGIGSVFSVVIPLVYAQISDA